MHASPLSALSLVAAAQLRHPYTCLTPPAAAPVPPPPHTHTLHTQQTHHCSQAFTRGMYELMKSGLGVTDELPGAPKKSEAAAAADKEDSEEDSDKSEL